ncbi:MAG: aconitate hydratase [Candidatus Midichloriaceae bacterium]|jgi:aconitate hydratase
MKTHEIKRIQSKLKIGTKEYTYCSLKKAAEILDFNLDKVPNVLKILAENLLRNCDEKKIKIQNIINLLQDPENFKGEILFHPSRVLMQDFTGVPAIVDLAAMRDAVKDKNLDPTKINPKIPVDLVIDHSVQVDKYGFKDSFAENTQIEMERNKERYEFLKWGQQSFENFRVVPPGTGICHQVNLEYLAKIVVSNNTENEDIIFFDTVVGTDSHTTMINALSVLGWGVGGIEAEAAMLGQPIPLLAPKIVGVELVGKLNPGVTATDLVLTITSILRKKGVVGKFVEFHGDGLKNLSLFERATISNMAPEYGATCGYFPIDQEVLNYMHITGRDEQNIKLVEQYAKEQCIWQDYDKKSEIQYSETVTINLNDIQPCIAGPKRPQDKINLADFKFKEIKKQDNLQDGDIVISAITSCTNTSNPYVLIGAALLAKAAYEKGLRTKSWVKTSFAPGSQVVTEYLKKSGLMKYLEAMGFYLVGYGCTTCIGNSGPLDQEISKAIEEENLSVAAVLSGNRNFEGRIHPLVKENYLASPMLCVVYAIVGNINVDILNSNIGVDTKGNNIYLKDIWPSNTEIHEIANTFVNRDVHIEKYKNIFEGDDSWKKIKVSKELCYSWDDKSTYIKKPPFFIQNEKSNNEIQDIVDARILLILGDSTTTDHISPAGNIQLNHSAGQYLISKKVNQKDFNSFGSRRGNDEVMTRGTFCNVRIKNKMADGKEGGYTKHYNDMGKESFTTIYDAAQKYKDEKVPLVVFAGKEYGTGSSRDWAAKGTKLLGVKVVVAESFERIHRSNLIGMGVLPLQLIDTDLNKLSLDGTEKISILGYNQKKPKEILECRIEKSDSTSKSISLLSRIDTELELAYFSNNGILNYVLRNLIY